MRGLWAVAATSFLMLAGCVAPPADETVSLDRSAPERPADIGALPALAANVSLGLDGLKEFHWALMNDTESLVLEVKVDFGDKNKCEVATGGTVSTAESGPAMLVLEEFGAGVGWSTMSRGHLASAHAAGLDTRDVAPSGDVGMGFMSFSRGTFDGEATFTFVMHDLEAGNDFTGGAAAAFSIDCKEPFSILGARGGTMHMLANADNLDGGIGADAIFVGTVEVGDVANVTLLSPATRAAVGAFGDYAKVGLKRPTGTDEWTMTPVVGGSVTEIVDDGPGEFKFTVDQVSRGALWVGAWGLDGPIDLRPGQLEETVLESPF